MRYDGPNPRYLPRRHLWLTKGEPLVCPSGHRLKHNAGILQHETFICPHREPGQPGECGARVYVLQMAYGLRFVAEVTVQEWLEMRDRCRTVEDVINYLRGQSA